MNIRHHHTFHVKLVLFCIGCAYCYTVPATIHIGGLFQAICYNNESLVETSFGKQHLAAFLMAVDEINKNLDILPESRLSVIVNQGMYSDASTSNSYHDGAVAGYDLMISSPGELVAVISGADLQHTAGSSKVLNDWSVPELIATASLAGQDDISSDSMNIQMQPSDAALAVAISNWMAWDNVGVFYSQSEFGLLSYRKFLRGRKRSFDLLFAMSIPTETSDFSSYIDEAKKLGSMIFVLFMGPELTGMLMEQGHAAGLFTLNTQVIGTASSSSIWRTMSPSADIPTIMRGYLTMVLSSELYYQKSKGRDFLSRLRVRPPTHDPTFGNCSNLVDDGIPSDKYSNRFIYKHPTTLEGRANFTCTGVTSYAVFNSNGSNVEPSVLYTYDAVYALAYACHAMIQQQLKISGLLLYQFMLEQTLVMEGTTGNISFHRSGENSNSHGKSERSSGGLFTLLNFQVSRYVGSNGTEGFARVGYYDADLGVKLCADINPTNDIQLQDCSPVVYNTEGDGLTPPTGRKPDLVFDFGQQFRGVYIIALIAMTLLWLLEILFLCWNWGERELQNAQPRLLSASLFGEFCAILWCIFSANKTSLSSCLLEFITGHLMVVSLMTPLQLKLWRIHKIVSAPAFTRIRISEGYAVVWLAGVIVIAAGYLMSILLFGDIGLRRKVFQHSNQRIIELYCTEPQSSIGVALYAGLIAFEALLVLTSLRFLWLTRGVPSCINEISIIGPLFLNSLAVIAIVGVLYFVVPLSKEASSFMINFTILVAVTWSTARYFLEKRRKIRQRKFGAESGNVDGPIVLELERRVESPVRLQLSPRGEYVPESNPVPHSVDDSDWGQTVEFVNALLRQRPSVLQKARLCQEQIFLWKSVMVKLKEIEDEDQIPLMTIDPNDDNVDVVAPEISMPPLPSPKIPRPQQELSESQWEIPVGNRASLSPSFCADSSFADCEPENEENQPSPYWASLSRIDL